MPVVDQYDIQLAKSLKPQDRKAYMPGDASRCSNWDVSLPGIGVRVDPLRDAALPS